MLVITRNAWQSPACSPPGANAPAKLMGYWTKGPEHRMKVGYGIFRRFEQKKSVTI